MPQPIKQTKKVGARAQLTGDQKALLNRQFISLASEMMSRTGLSERLGKSYTGSGSTPKRDIYTALGYTKEPTYHDYYARYRRQDIAGAVVDALPNACWRLKPTVTDSMEQETNFEKELATIIKTKRVWHYLSRADKISGIGEYAAILMGFDDTVDFDKELVKAKSLLFLRPYTQEYIAIGDIESDKSSERYGKPKFYTVTYGEKDQANVHHSRIIHVSEGLVEDDLHGTPRLERCLNRLQDLELIAGGSSEMYWRGAFPGLAFSAQADAQFDTQALEDLEDEIQDYLHELRRYIRMQGIDVKELTSQVVDPSNHVDMLITLIAAATRIPKRILVGSERGELASSQDERSWIDRIEERRSDHVEVNIIRPFIDTLITTGIVSPPPNDSYNVVWPALIVEGDSERYANAVKVADAISKYVSTPGSEMVVPVEMFLTKFLGFTKDEVEQARDYIGGELEGEYEEEEEQELEGEEEGEGEEE